MISLHTISTFLCRNANISHVHVRAFFFHSTVGVRGFDEFFDSKKINEMVMTGRSWTVPDLRRKSFEDLHKLWFVLYKERNLVLSEREKSRRNQRALLQIEENRYIKIKRSMAALKHVLSERRKIDKLILQQQTDIF